MIKMTPAQAHSLKDSNKLWEAENVDLFRTNEHPPKFKVGDIVRLNRSKQVFEKGYEPSWTREIFKVSKVKHTVPWTYIITDLKGDPIEGSFYEPELQLSHQTAPENWLVEKDYEVLGSKGNGATFFLHIQYKKKKHWEPIESFVKDGYIDSIAYQYIVKHKLSKKAGI